MKIVVLNAGSGSQRVSFFNLPETQVVHSADGRDPDWEAALDATEPGQPVGRLNLTVRGGDGRRTIAGTVAREASVAERTEQLLTLLWRGQRAPLAGPDGIDVVGHRVVHGGPEFDGPVLLDGETEAAIQRFAAFAPLHNPNNLTGVRVARRLLGDATRQVAVFDTAFHRTLDAVATTYPGPHDWADRGVRRYGFHGTSFRWATERAAAMLGAGREAAGDLRLIICHLGGGCSLCATRGGRSVATTMGFTPLDGIAMSTRSGAIDPGILIYLLREGMNVDDLEYTLNRRSGLAGLSGLAGDTREVLPQADAGHPRAQLAWKVFVARLAEGVGAMLAALGERPHALVFTDVIGENEPRVRSDVAARFGFLGLKIDEAKNAAARGDSDVSAAGSAPRVLVVEAREAWQIARECHAWLCEGRQGGGLRLSSSGT